MKSISQTKRSVGTLTMVGNRCRRSPVLACFAAALSLLSSGHSQSNPGTFEVLHAFGASDGAYPAAGLLRDAQGNLYGTTVDGSGSGGNNIGVVFKIDPRGNETVLYSFNGTPDGANPTAGLIQDSAGNLYGTTSAGGTNNIGTVFKLDTAGKETVLHSFAGPDGASPHAGLVQDGDGNLYGTTSRGGADGSGAIFKFDTAGNWTVLYSFTGQADGAHPNDLILDKSGNLYGTAFSGGLQNCINFRNVNAKTGCGTVFKLDSTGVFTVLYSFQGDIGPDGARPLGGLVADPAGKLYGTTYVGGQPDCSISSPTSPPKAIGCGTVFELDTTGAEHVLHAFVVTDGWFPPAGLVIDPSGNLYGTASSNIFELDASGNLNVLFDFTGEADGGFPEGPLLRDSAGDLYGTANSGGSGYGVVFELPAATSPVFNVVITLGGSGTGTVTSNPSGFNCPPDCISAFPVGTTVTLTAAPTGGSIFAYWSGNCSTTNADVCMVDTSGDLAAVFNPPPDFTVSASAFTPSAVNPGIPASSTITTTAIGGFSGSITLSCAVQSSVAFAPTCSVSPTSVSVGTSAKLTVTTTGPTASLVTPFGSGPLYATGLPLLGLLLGGLILTGRNRPWKVRFRLACLLLAGMFSQMACGGNGSKWTPAGNYTVVVTGVSGSLQHSVNPNPTLTVQ